MRIERCYPLIIDSQSSTLIDVAPGVVGAAHGWTGLDVAEAELFTLGLKFLKFFRRDVAFDFELAVGRSQILSDGDDVDVVLQIAQDRHHFIAGFTGPQAVDFDARESVLSAQLGAQRTLVKARHRL